ncbi:MAG: site-2 protease family protein [Myxococcales bacterium]|jgi:Zn-dependent protease/CBS domain-containing protein|nr:site-2 protease family protein [Myxococcales bacterium]
MKQPHAPRSRWSWSIGRIAGIEIKVHGTFLALLAWILVSHLVAGEKLAAATQGVLSMIALFGIVILHELGHALTARRFGIRTRDITLLPIGGVARLEKMPDNPRQELLVAIAGPLVNVALAIVAFAGMRAVGAPWSPQAVGVVGGSLLAKLFWANVALAVFNLLPAFPLDGGRVLRALLALRMGRVRATDIAARIGQLMALLFGLAGLFGSPMLVFVALFVWIGAAEEDALVHMNAALERVRVGDAMVTRFETLDARDPVGLGVERAIHALQRDFPVLDGARLVGVVSAAELIRRAAAGGAGDAIGNVMIEIDDSAAPGELVEVALERLTRAELPMLPVLDSGELVGLLVPENVAQVAGLRDAAQPR